jgi:hypothetical protein
MKTALQELDEIIEKHIRWIEGHHKADEVSIYYVSKMVDELLKKEKQQISIAFEAGDINIFCDKTGEQYYNETYTSNAPIE